MNRILLEEILKRMKINLENKKDIGHLKVGALYAIGSQLEAIFYFIGHELGSKLIETSESEAEDLPKLLADVAEKYELGVFNVKEADDDHIVFSLGNCKSSEDICVCNIKVDYVLQLEPFIRRLVEKKTKKHCSRKNKHVKSKGLLMSANSSL